MFGEISKLYSNEKRFVSETQVKYYIFTTVLDYLLANQWFCGLDAVSISSVQEWLIKRATRSYMWGVSVAQTKLWLQELVWLKMISLNEEKQELSLTQTGYEACQDQRFHSVYASLLEAKHSRQIAILALVIAFITAIFTFISLFCK